MGWLSEQFGGHVSSSESRLSAAISGDGAAIDVAALAGEAMFGGTYDNIVDVAPDYFLLFPSLEAAASAAHDTVGTHVVRAGREFALVSAVPFRCRHRASVPWPPCWGSPALSGIWKVLKWL